MVQGFDSKPLATMLRVGILMGSRSVFWPAGGIDGFRSSSRLSRIDQLVEGEGVMDGVAVPVVVEVGEDLLAGFGPFV